MSFDSLIDRVLSHEGGYVNDPRHNRKLISNELLRALASAILLKSQQAASVFVSPKNVRNYSCCAADCSRPAYAKGLCNAHYLRRRLGKPDSIPVRARKREDACKECGQLTGAKGGWGLCAKHYKKARRDVLKDAAISCIGPNCASCGGSFPRAVFDFHHVGDKSASPSSMFINSSLLEIAEELSRCILLCANCHRIIHANDL